jgi:hypothetical protein
MASHVVVPQRRDTQFTRQVDFEVMDKILVHERLVHLCTPNVYHANPGIRRFGGGNEPLNVHLVKHKTLLPANEEQGVRPTPVVFALCCALAPAMPALLFARKVETRAKCVVARAVSGIDCEAAAHAADDRLNNGLLRIGGEEANIKNAAVDAAESRGSPYRVAALVTVGGCCCTLMKGHFRRMKSFLLKWLDFVL